MNYFRTYNPQTTIYVVLTAILFSNGVLHAQQQSALETYPDQPKDVVKESALSTSSAGDRMDKQPHYDLNRSLKEGNFALTAKETARLAVIHSPSIRGAKAALTKAQEGAARAWVGVFPLLELSARYTRLGEVEQGEFMQGGSTEGFDSLQTLVDQHRQDSSAGADFDQAILASFRQLGDMRFPQILDQIVFRASITYPLTDLFLSILPGYQAAVGMSEAQKLRLQAERQRVALQAYEAFYSYVRAKATLVVAQASLIQAEAHRKDIQALVNTGSVARVELMRMNARVAAVQGAVSRTRGGAAIAKSALEAITGRPIKGEISIAEDLEKPLSELDQDVESMVAEAKKRRPEMLAQREILKAYQNSRSASSGARLPHLAISAGVDYANPNQRIFPQESKFAPSWDVSAILSWTPNSLFEGNHRVAEADADLLKVHSDMIALEDALRVEITQAYYEYQSARYSVEAARSGIQAAEENFRIRREQFRAGAAVATEVIDADSELRDARLALIDAMIEIRIARSRIYRAIGKL